ncbi:MAG: hypothetical protein JOZ10_17635 [Acidobacteria bacterium]|nr:hypothetical protein [Acidobacteriota bacterium]MBV9437889.1 hypothetical protein [Acidobacteriota bacterium]
MRRIVSGKGMYTINNVVDINNLVSLNTFHAVGTYDLKQSGPTTHVPNGLRRRDISRNRERHSQFGSASASG